MVRWITIVLAVVGVAVAAYAVASTKTTPVQAPLARRASVNPFASGVAALGLVEPAGRDVSVVAPESGLVTKVHVDVGDAVKAGDALYELDARSLQADLLRAEAAVGAAEAEIARWHALPRAEDLPPLEASVARAQAQLADREEAMRLTEQVQQRGANNERDVSLARYARDAAAAELERARGDLARVKAGGWRPDLVVAQAVLTQKKAEVEALKVLRDRLVVRAPRDGRVLRRTIEPGETASVDTARPAMILGDLSRLNIRAQVDEEDIALVAGANGASSPTRNAVARTRGSVVTDIPLRLLRVEPYARPKTDLTGSNVERVDTRVIDVLFGVVDAPAGVPLLPGLAVDVFIEGTAEGGS
jgi:multidrug efflux pump subunit AcrA (membrane-fusion protein)